MFPSSKYTELTELWLCNNVLSTLPAELSELRTLTVLSVKGNQLNSIPPELGLLSKLKRLYLGGNKLQNLPDTLRDLTILDDLDISCNSFDSVPHVVCTLKSVTRLNLAGNAFNFLPSKLAKLRSLTLLDLSHTVVRGESSVLQGMGWTKILGWDSIPRSTPSSSSAHLPAPSSPSPTTPLAPSSDGIKTHPLIPSEASPTPPTRRLSTTPYFLFPTKPVQLHSTPTPLGTEEGEIEQFLRGRAGARVMAKLKRRRGKRSSLSTPY